MADDYEAGIDSEGPEPGAAGQKAPPAAENELDLVKRKMREIKLDLEHHKKAFDRMRDNMFLAMNGRTKDWSERNYSANIVGRHINQSVAALYAKNPKAVAKRRETLDFRIWDENPQTVVQSMQLLQQAQQIMAATTVVGPGGQMLMGPPPPGVAEAQALLEDVQQGMNRRDMIKRIGKTMEVLFAQALREQQPVDFKTAMKQVVRRAKTTGVAYVMYDFQRVLGERPPLVMSRIVDSETRLAHLQSLIERLEGGELDETKAEMAELQHTLEALRAEPPPVDKEGLVFDFPSSLDVIPDRLTKSLVGFLGARHVTVRYMMTRDQIKRTFPETDLGDKYTPYTVDGTKSSEKPLGTYDGDEADGKKDGLVCVYKHFDRISGCVYWMCDGYDRLLRPAAPPSVTVENFFPIEALTFNEVESDKDLFPPSDVALLKCMQEEYNFSRQGKADHRRAAKPRWGVQKGVLEAGDQDRLGSAQAFDVVELAGLGDGQKVSDVLQEIPVPGVDPNLYDVNEILSDMQFTVGTSEAIMGGVSKATATESSIAANSSASSIDSAVDDLDGFLTRIARNSGQIMMREMSPEYVQKVAGVGAVWPPMTIAEIQEDLFLEVEAGSTGKPNRAVEINNWERMLPSLLQMPGLSPAWVARETLRRLDDRMDLTEAVIDGLPSVTAMNRLMGAAPAPGPAGTNDPASQGPAGGDNAPAPPGGPGGSDAAFGSNQV